MGTLEHSIYQLHKFRQTEIVQLNNGEFANGRVNEGPLGQGCAFTHYTFYTLCIIASTKEKGGSLRASLLIIR